MNYQKQAIKNQQGMKNLPLSILQNISKTGLKPRANHKGVKLFLKQIGKSWCGKNVFFCSLQNIMVGTRQISVVKSSYIWSDEGWNWDLGFQPLKPWSLSNKFICFHLLFEKLILLCWVLLNFNLTRRIYKKWILALQHIWYPTKFRSFISH